MTSAPWKQSSESHGSSHHTLLGFILLVTLHAVLLSSSQQSTGSCARLFLGNHSSGLRRRAPDLQRAPLDWAALCACRGVLRDTTEVVTKAKMFRWKPDGVVTHITAQTADGWPAPIMQVSPGRGRLGLLTASWPLTL